MPSGYDPVVDQTIRWDDRGNPYQVTGSGRRSYLSPLVAAQYRNDPKLLEWARSQGVTISNGQVTDTSWDGQKKGGPLSGSGITWNQQEGKWDKPTADALYSAGVTSLVGMGIADALKPGGLFPGGPDKGGPLPNPDFAPVPQGVPPGLPGASPLPLDFVPVPGGAPVPPVPPVPPAAPGQKPLGGIDPTSAAPSLIDRLGDKLKDPQTYEDLAKTVIPGLVAAATGNGGAGDPFSNPTVQELLKMNLKRQQRTDPLHESVTQLSMAMLPTAYQRRG